MQTLTRVLRRQEMDTVVVTCKERRSGYDEKGKKVITEKEVPQLVQVPTKVSDLNKAAELLGKRYALFTDKVETDVDMDLNITINQIFVTKSFLFFRHSDSLLSFKWTSRDSNPGPIGYEPIALTC